MGKHSTIFGLFENFEWDKHSSLFGLFVNYVHENVYMIVESRCEEREREVSDLKLTEGQLQRK